MRACRIICTRTRILSRVVFSDTAPGLAEPNGWRRYEGEYLFSPFSVFELDDVDWRAGTKVDPHVITLKADADAQAAPLDLPLAPWI